MDTQDLLLLVVWSLWICLDWNTDKKPVRASLSSQINPMPWPEPITTEDQQSFTIGQKNDTAGFSLAAQLIDARTLPVYQTFFSNLHHFGIHHGCSPEAHECDKHKVQFSWAVIHIVVQEWTRKCQAIFKQ